MVRIQSLVFCAVLFTAANLFAQTSQQKPQSGKSEAAPKGDDAIAKIVREGGEKFIADFNAGKVDELTNTFLADGEYIDESGAVYQGQKEIKELFSTFFTKFPGTKLAMDIESSRMVGPLLIEEGVRVMTPKEGAASSKFRFISIRTKSNDGWKIASFRDIAADDAPTANDALQSLGWLAGDWINEGADGSVAISFKWTDDQNFLVGDFQMKSGDGAGRKSTQRYGWDASTGKIRAWLFDADGGFAEGHGSVTADGVVFKFSSVNPDGTTGSATITLEQKDKDRFSMKGTDRVVADGREPDFELDVVRRPPTAGGK